ncbi:MAG: acyltransferase [Luteolibacter sp.]|uniref:acyltransferase family protein n=1 Tax=Luteolibacter sp. TaxID=1962973 RepID=UPI003266CEFF
MSGRATQLDGLRAVAMIAISWDHWCPPTWPRIFPFEVFLFFFLVLTGYLITGSLLRERDRKEARGGPWKWEGLKSYQIRRGLRILAPYYAALALALLIQAPDAWMGRAADSWQGFPWYFFHLSNFHIAKLGDWPGGTNHFWSLAIQQQFYLIWPFVIWFLPRKCLLPAILIFSAIGPISRHYHDLFLPWFAWPQTLTWFTFDYFGIGGLLALAVHRGVSLESPVLRGLAVAGLAGYVVIFGSHALGWPTYGLRALQQTFLAIALCGFIAAGFVGFRGPLGRFLENGRLQRIGQVSYGIYLFHNIAPLVAGKIFWFLWFGCFDNIYGEIIRIPVYAAVTWALTMASWRWIETPLQEVRAKIGSR